MKRVIEEWSVCAEVLKIGGERHLVVTRLLAGRGALADPVTARQLAGFDAAIKEDSVQKSAADLNAAINYGRAGDLQSATVYMKRAAADPQRRLAVEDLRQVLGVPRW